MAVLQGEQARQAMARMQARANQVPVESTPQPVALQATEDAQRACA